MKKEEKLYLYVAMYEWWLALKQLGNAHEDCGHCVFAAKYLEKSIGASEVGRLKRLVKKNPYKAKKNKTKLTN